MQSISNFVVVIVLVAAIVGCMTLTGSRGYERPQVNTEHLDTVGKSCYQKDITTRFERITNIMPNCRGSQMSSVFELLSLEYIKAIMVVRKTGDKRTWLRGYQDACRRVSRIEICSKQTLEVRRIIEKEELESTTYFQHEVANAFDGECIYREIYNLIYNMAWQCSSALGYQNKEVYRDGYLAALRANGFKLESKLEEDYRHFVDEKEKTNAEFESKRNI